VNNWLYGVALNVARRAHAMNRRRRARELAAVASVPTPPGDGWHPAESLIDDELGRLPDRYRTAILTCGLEGKTIAEAAAFLGWPPGTVATRLARGRELLARRLARHGVAVPAALLSAGTGGGMVSAVVPESLIAATVRVGVATGAVPAAVLTLTNEVTRAMFFTKLMARTAVIAALATAGGVTTVAVGQMPARKPAEAPSRPMPTPPVPIVANPAIEDKPREIGTVGPPVPGEPEWKTEFRKVYALADGQNVKAIPSPFADCRVAFWADRDPRNQNPKASSQGYRLSFLDDGQKLSFRIGMSCLFYQTRPEVGSGLRLEEIIELVCDIPAYEIVGDRRLLTADEQRVDADFVTRTGATQEQLVAGLQSELRDKFHKKVRLTLVEEERQVVVATGQFRSKPREGQEANHIDIIADEDAINPYPPFRPNRYDFPGFLRTLGTFIALPVINEAERTPEGRVLTARTHRPMPFRVRYTPDPEKVLDNVSTQTGLTFKQEKRKVSVLKVERDAEDGSNAAPAGTGWLQYLWREAGNLKFEQFGRPGEKPEAPAAGN
jgi:hypothetical protein